MNNKNPEKESIVDDANGVAAVAPAVDALDETRAQLCEVSETNATRSRPEISRFANMLVRLLDLSECWHDESEARLNDVQKLPEFVTEGVACIEAAMSDDEAALEKLSEQLEVADQRWGEYLQLLDNDSGCEPLQMPWESLGTEFDDAAPAEEEEPEAFEVPSADELSALLSQMNSETADDEGDAPAAAAARPLECAVAENGDDDVELNDALREAFLDDAQRCLQSFEDALLRLESQPADAKAIGQIGRELHTLKGAAGSVGLAKLADSIHETEEWLQQSGDALNEAQLEQLFAALDQFRTVVGRLGSPPVASSPTATDRAASEQTAPETFGGMDEAVADESTVRIKQTQLTRLMDMLAELVMLRNRRDSELATLKTIQKDLVHSAARLRQCCDAISDPTTPLTPETLDLACGSARLTEIAGDVLEAGQQLHDVYQPIVDSNRVVSQIARQFRHELVELRRVPIANLFRRLRRAVRDAARVEEKRVELQIVGGATGIERAVQERLYEPMLHLVRNCVSHGIEAPEARRQAAKSETGTITLNASAGPDLLRIEIQDDGRGLDYDALRRRGIEKGLIRADQASTEEELAQLIFHPGFSTKETASQIAGRGVGMDVVAEAIERMRGWIEIDSLAGRGTTIRLTLPQPSVIGHAMVFRAAGQLFAIPMQFVETADSMEDAGTPLNFAEILGATDETPPEELQTLVLRRTNSSGDSSSQAPCIGLQVEEILGPEELVIRPLPNLLKQHPYFSGATLSGTGHTVLLIDSRRLLARAEGTNYGAYPSQPGVDRSPSLDRPKVLVVDDSRSARLCLLQVLEDYDCETVEATDGSEAIKLLKQQHFDAIFSDFEMPVVDGIGVLNEVHSGRYRSPVPTVIISSRKEQSFRDAALNGGAAAYLNKPIEAAVLHETIRAVPAMGRLYQSHRSR